MKQEEDGPRYETCIYCGLRWNVSVNAIWPPGLYICPVCSERPNKKRKGKRR